MKKKILKKDMAGAKYNETDSIQLQRLKQNYKNNGV